jgi:steroid 5-alpha reductase family enzyme
MLMDILLPLMIALGINLTIFLVAFKLQTDKLTDVSYALTFIVLTLFTLFSHSISTVKVVGAGMVCLWGLRLGSFLLYRIRKTGKDRRFDEMRGNFKQFLQFWVLQGVSAWIILIPLVVLLASKNTIVSIVGVLGAMLWLFGLVVEAIADWQKYHFNTNPTNKGTWIDQGIWKYSRHPNYFGEICVWVGLYIFAVPSLTTGQVVLAIVSPLFITSLLLFVSGIPKLEQSADERWGDNKDYQEYKRRTSLLVLSPKRPAKR